jgi:hypothetical protein
MKMKKLQILGIALAAVFAFGVVSAASASATVTFLLAEWLVNGVAVPEGTEKNVEETGTFLVEDTKTLLGKADVLCSWIFVLKISFAGVNVVVEVLGLTKEAISATPLSGLALECTSDTSACEEPLVWPVKLPWNALLVLMEEGTEVFFADLMQPSGSNTSVGWYVQCEKTILKPSDECTVAEGVSKLGLKTTELTAALEESFTQLAELKLFSCTQSKEESGILETEAAAPGVITLVEGGTLSASSESSEA